MKRVHRTVAMLATGIVALTLSSRALAGGDFPTTDLPPPAGTYISPDLYHVLFANGIIIKDVSHDKFTQGHLPPPNPGSTIHTFGSHLRMSVSIDNGNTYNVVDTFGNCTVRVDAAGFNGSTALYDTEMLQLDISGGTLPVGVMVRESPTRASVGKTTITPNGNGSFHIDSFFDIFTELSLDSGATWSPATNAGHMELIPEPSSIAMVGLGVVGLAARRRRKAA